MSVHYKIGKLIKLLEQESNLFDEVFDEVDSSWTKIGASLSGKKIDYEQFMKSNSLFLGDTLINYLQTRIKETQLRVDSLTKIRSMVGEGVAALKRGDTVEVVYMPASEDAEG